MSDPTDVVNCHPALQIELVELLKPYGLTIVSIADDALIPGSFFGEREAGLIGNMLYLRYDTPVHSALHEAGHFICMDAERRAQLDTNADAEGLYDEENAVCYLQILLADYLPTFNRARMIRDMDRWGYSFRLGSTKLWFEQDAEDAALWLQKYDIITINLQPTWRLRQELV